MKRHFFFLALIAGMFLVSCGEGDNPQIVSDKATLKPEGGSITLKNGVTLNVLPGTVQSATQIEVSYAEDLTNDFGPMPNVQGLITFSPEGMVFDKAIEVTMPLSEPVKSNTTNIVYWSEIDNTWYITDIGTIKDGKVSFYVEHFSSYASVGGGWIDIFGLMDSYVAASAKPELDNDSPEMVHFLETECWENLGWKDLKIATYASMGGSLVHVCAKTCGLMGSWHMKDTLSDEVKQSIGRFKEDSKDNIYTYIGLTESYMTSHMRNGIVIEEKSKIIDRSIEIRYNACPTEIVGQASPASVEVGKTTEVIVTAHCDGDPLRDQLLQFQYSPEISCDVVNKKTDSNGQVKLTVKGKQEGKGIVYVKAVCAMHSDYETNIEIPINVGAAEWEIEFRLPVTKTAHLVSVDSYDEGYGESKDLYDRELGIRGYSYSGDTKSVSYTIAGRARIKQAGNQYIPEIKMEVPCITGTASIWIEEGSVSYDYPEWKSSWEYWDTDENRIRQDVEEYKIEYETHYTIHHLPEHSFTTMFYNNRAQIKFHGDGASDPTLFTDSTLYTMSEHGTHYWYDDKGKHSRTYTDSSNGAIRVVTDATQFMVPVALYCNVSEEGTFTLYHSYNSNPTINFSEPYIYSAADGAFHNVFFTETNRPYSGCMPKIEKTVDGEGTITVRLVTPEEE